MTSRLQIAVPGGTTPFTLAFLAALQTAELPPLDLRLWGRNHRSGRAIAEFAARMIDPAVMTVRACEHLQDTLDGASVVLHQVRYGDLDGRHADEMLSAQFDVPPDETLGPGGLQAALRTARMLTPVAEAIARYCPHSWVINLTNPLSVVTTLLAQDYGVQRCVGVCELPDATAQLIANVLMVPVAALDWSYSGLNHRGFLHDVSLNGDDMLPRVADGVDAAGGLGSVSGSVIRELNAVPLKYFNMLQDPGAHLASGRAQHLAALRRKIRAQLGTSPDAWPDALTERSMPWYPDAVIPLLQTLAGKRNDTLCLSVPVGTGVTQERRVIHRDGQFVAGPGADPPPAIQPLLAGFSHHEGLVMRAARTPTRRAIRAALEADPMVRDDRLEDCVTAILAGLQT